MDNANFGNHKASIKNKKMNFAILLHNSFYEINLRIRIARHLSA